VNGEHFRMGSLRCEVRGARGELREYFEDFFRQELSPRANGRSDLVWLMTPTQREFGETHRRFQREGLREFRLGKSRLRAFYRPEPRPQVSVLCEPGELTKLLLPLATNLALFSMRRFYAHAGAIAYRGRGALFYGDSGSGKSTVSLALACRGADLLSDDHVLLNFCGKTPKVSGVSGRARIGAKSERFVFGRRIIEDYRWIPKTRKKDFCVADYVSSTPHVEKPLRTLFFPRLGNRFHARPLASSEAMYRLLAINQNVLFLSKDPTFATYLSYLTALAGLRAWDLTLPRDAKGFEGAINHILEILRFER